MMKIKKITFGGISFDIKNFYNKYGILCVMVLMFVIASFISPVFLTSTNLINVLTQISVVTIVAAGMTMLIISGTTDLSAGSVVALAGCLCVGTCKNLIASGMGTVPAAFIGILVAVVIAAMCNVSSAVIITKFEAPPFIVTLAMMQIARGLVYIYTNGQQIYDIGNVAIIGQGRIGFIPYSVLIMLAVLIISWIILNKLRFGRYLYAVGGNIEAAIASGIRTSPVIIKSFLIHGVFVGIAGILYMTRLNSGQPAEAVGLEFDAIIAAIVGGTSFSGGIGTITGTICGCVIIGILNNILNLMFVQSYYQQVIKGLIIVTAVILDIKTKVKKN
ncbi:permease component of ribose/xylose/arabinose/galactoside ABC-type transporters [Sphaerochaeta pleomorpha str. Grapes]|uniref:Permease component of ribose/xylose/arabinose/galactoside ABC-type transporters n=1 Tax=Sphaerochaeta pleomorpha (strain ATCC BAA-1885 / DSM 22778 / Grapes) TaxID=158190 RepID=G8QXI4_SPHPG|nr:ABC transporter permease [Sphaerochaeta pleomorpha]AEV29547.1 permease component of ribose/xylose/arabinose/galactoside ABC-type transporters [Sphaerochaeta pleomorpha str. Grapes]